MCISSGLSAGLEQNLFNERVGIAEALDKHEAKVGYYLVVWIVNLYTGCVKSSWTKFVSCQFFWICISPQFFDSVLFPVSFSICLSNFIIIGDFSRKLWHQKKRGALSLRYTRRESLRLLSQRRSVWREAVFTARSTGTRSLGDSKAIQGAADPRPPACL